MHDFLCMYEVCLRSASGAEARENQENNIFKGKYLILPLDFERARLCCMSGITLCGTAKNESLSLMYEPDASSIKGWSQSHRQR